MLHSSVQNILATINFCYLKHKNTSMLQNIQHCQKTNDKLRKHIYQKDPKINLISV